MWQVELTSDEDNQFRATSVFGLDYFPRKFHYKKDARKLKDRLDMRMIQCEIKYVK